MPPSSGPSFAFQEHRAAWSLLCHLLHVSVAHLWGCTHQVTSLPSHCVHIIRVSSFRRTARSSGLLVVVWFFAWFHCCLLQQCCCRFFLQPFFHWCPLQLCYGWICFQHELLYSYRLQPQVSSFNVLAIYYEDRRYTIHPLIFFLIYHRDSDLVHPSLYIGMSR